MIRFTFNHLEHLQVKKPNQDEGKSFATLDILTYVTKEFKVLKGKVHPLSEESYKAWPKEFLDESLSILEYKVFQQEIHPDFQASLKENLKGVIRMFQDKKRRKQTTFL